MSKSSVVMSWKEGVRYAEAWVRANRDTLERAAIVGSVLRQKDECHDVDLLVIPKPGCTLVEPDPPINVFTTSLECWQPALMQYAPSAGSTIGARAAAKARGYRLSQYGLFLGQSQTCISRDAREIYGIVGATMSRWVVRSLAGEGVLVLEATAHPVGGYANSAWLAAGLGVQ